MVLSILSYWCGKQEVVLSSQQDAFFKSNMYENFGDLGANIKKLVDEFQQKAKSNQNIQSLGQSLESTVCNILCNVVHEIIVCYPCNLSLSWNNIWHSIGWNDAEDMVKFVENYPEYRKQHGNVSKHVTMMTELSRIVDERQLMAISQIEQELACNAGQAVAFEVWQLNAQSKKLWKSKGLMDLNIVESNIKIRVNLTSLASTFLQLLEDVLSVDRCSLYVGLLIANGERCLSMSSYWCWLIIVLQTWCCG